MALGIGIAVTVVAAWSLFLGVLAFWLVAQGLNWAQSLLLAAIKVLAAAVMVMTIRQLSSRLGFPTLRRTLFRITTESQRDEDSSATTVGTPYPG